MKGDDVLDRPRGGKCPRCGAALRVPEEEYEYDEDGVPHVVPGLGEYWCPACGWAADEGSGT